VAHAVYLAERLAAELDFMHVIDGVEDSSPYWFVPGQVEAELEDAFRTTQGGAQLMALVTDHATRLATRARGRLHFGAPARAIARVAEVDLYDLIVMGTHGRHGLAHLLAGSIAQAVIQHAPCAVLTVCSRRSAGRESAPGDRARGER